MKESNRTLRSFVVLTLLVAGVAVAVVATGGGQDRYLRAEFDSALGTFDGMDVRLAGSEVGEVDSIAALDGGVVLTLRIDDERAWPLPRGTSARIRLGPVATLASRYIELTPGRPRGEMLPSGGVLTKTAAPVEFDDVNRILTRAGRRGLQGMIRDFAGTIEGHESELKRGIRPAAAGFDATAALQRELGADPRALQVLAASGARMWGAIARRRSRLVQLIDHAGRTFDELAAHTRSTDASLRRLAPTLSVTRRALSRLDVSIPGLRRLLADVRPGAERLRQVAPVADRAITTLRRVAPVATAALEQSSRAVPGIGRLLHAGSPFFDDVEPVLDGAATIFSCLRPYAPELAAVASTWAGFSTNYDANGHYIRGLVTAIPFGAGETRDSEQLVSGSGGTVRYAFPAPPGLNVGEPWFQPQCGAGPEGLDPARDPEAGG